MRVDTAWRGEANHLLQERVVLGQHLERQFASPDYFLLMIDVMQERIQCFNPLFNPARNATPFRSRNDPWDHVKRD